jgi:hypothetical protein
MTMITSTNSMNLLLSVALLWLSQVPVQNVNGSIDGIVQRTGTNAPIAGAHISLTDSAGRNTKVDTDASGRFAFGDLAPGIYSIVVDREGYFGRIGPGRPTPLQTQTRVRSGDPTRIVLNLTPVSTITGRIRDDANRPMPGLTVEVMRLSANAQGRVWELVLTGNTNDRGEYRVSNLGSGDYYVRANSRVQSLFTTKDAGNATMTYFPGTFDALSAVPVRLSEGTEVTADIQFPPVDTALLHTVSGKVVADIPNLDRFPPTMLALVPRIPGAPAEHGISNSFSVLNFAAGASGEFQIRGVQSGSYDLFATARVSNWASLAQLRIEVRDENLRDIEVVLRPGFELTGKVTLEGAQGLVIRPGPLAGATVAPRQQTDLVLTLRRKDGFRDQFELGPLVETGSTAFSFPQVPAGEYDLTVSGQLISTGDVHVADIRQGAQSVFDKGFTVGPGVPQPLEIIVESGGGTIVGTVDERKSASVQVVAVPLTRRENAALYQAIGMNPATTEFRFRGMVPGDYKLFAWEISTTQPTGLPFRNAEFLSKYESFGTIVRVEKGATLGGLRIRMIPFSQ